MLAMTKSRTPSFQLVPSTVASAMVAAVSANSSAAAEMAFSLTKRTGSKRSAAGAPATPGVNASTAPCSSSSFDFDTPATVASGSGSYAPASKRSTRPSSVWTSRPS